MDENKLANNLIESNENGRGKPNRIKEVHEYLTA